MRRLVQPRVIASAAVAAGLSAVLSLPRMLLWDNRKLPLWHVESTILLGGFVLWAFVFAWHTEYTRRPVFTTRIKLPMFALATLGGVLIALGLHYLIDPSFSVRTPEEYPVDFQHWIAALLFSLAFTQLFLFFAPVAWAMRLMHNEKIATAFTVGLGVLVLALKLAATQTPVPYWLSAEYLGLRIAFGFLGVWFYLRGGVLLVWWLDLLIEARHLPGFFGW